MAGGVSTPAFVAAVAQANAFPFIAAGYVGPDRLASEISLARDGGFDFGVNLFVPSPSRCDLREFVAYARRLQSEADPYGLTLDPDPVTDDDWWNEKLALLRESPVPLVSFTFGLPTAQQVAQLRRRGTRVLATVTRVAEAEAAVALGVDGLVVQGPAAGGHSATFEPTRRIVDAPTAAVVRAVRSAVALPVIAAGGVDSDLAVQELFAAGAESVAVGSLLLRSDEAGTSATHRRALSDPAFTETAITRAFTGRPARGLRNGLMRRHENAPLDAYPAVHHLTRPLRQAAAAAGDPDRLHLWAGTGWRAARDGAVADTLSWLATRL